MFLTKSNSLYHNLFYSYTKIVLLLIFLIITIFSLVIDTSIVNSNIRSHISAAEKAADNLSYNLQQNITLAYTLANDEDVLHNLRYFETASRIEQVDYDIALTEIFNNYTGYNSGISKIRIFFPENAKKSIAGYKTVQYLAIFNDPEWIRFFQENISSISLEYTASAETYVSFIKNTDKIAIIVPVNYQKKNIAFLVMDIDKNILFSHNFSNYPYTVIDNRGTIIYDTFNLGMEKTFIRNIAKTPGASHNTIRKNGQKYLSFNTEITTHGFKIVQFAPHNILTKHRISIIFIYLVAVALFWIISLVFFKKNTLNFISPLTKLSNAMKNSDPIEANENLPTEILTLYNTYNHLLSENSKMINTISHSTKKQHKAEIKALLAQISPHFLYNTLNTVVWKATAAKQTEIATIISKLAKLCKISYSYTSDYVQMISEIQHMDLYLQLQKEAFRKNFNYDINLPDNLVDLYVPRFILQPLVENSIVHGFIQLSYDGNIQIDIQADNLLTITIKDNGTGISPDILSKLNDGNYKTEKYGIRNINQRIKMLCGTEYGIVFESNGYNYTKTTITLPLLHEHLKTDE